MKNYRKSHKTISYDIEDPELKQNMIEVINIGFKNSSLSKNVISKVSTLNKRNREFNRIRRKSQIHSIAKSTKIDKSSPKAKLNKTSNVSIKDQSVVSDLAEFGEVYKPKIYGEEPEFYKFDEEDTRQYDVIYNMHKRKINKEIKKNTKLSRWKQIGKN